VHLGLVRHQLGERVPEPERLRGQIDAAAVALVEDQIDDRQHGRQPVRQPVVGRNAEANARIPDLALRPRKTPLHRFLGNEEGARDLLGAQTAERAQGQRDLRLGPERGMTAGEDQLQPLVGKRPLLHLVLRGLGHVEQARLRGERAVATQAVDRAVAGGDREPGARIGRRAIARPALRGDCERLLNGLLGTVEIAEETDQAGEDAAPLVAKDLLEQRYLSTRGRTSIAPPIRAAGIRAAISSAASSSSASTTTYPPRCSFASTNGPSLSSVCPP
jgi:hypothetical protein